ncbi:cyclic peptide export ABC transporter [Chitinophaga ginsengisegetis]|uniref:cyclic peptide export ABC transporter n=1 Tax=Chitinophaga ginsengisegetis TaxID=393003 RepID=UPI0034171EFC
MSKFIASFIVTALRSIPFFVFLLVCSGHLCFAGPRADTIPLYAVDSIVGKLMKDGSIPGLSVAIISGNTTVFRNYGFADLDKKTPVTPATLFQIGSCSKAFTALAALKLQQAGLLDLDANVRDYLPWFQVSYNGKPAQIKIRHLLHHTSGLPWKTISLIPESDSSNALEKTIRNISGVKLANKPGLYFEYATVNYDILAYIIALRSGGSFEDYLQKNVLDSLGLAQTTIGAPKDSTFMSAGYKIGFFRPRRYDAPVYRGNNAAGYIISDIRDMAKWLKLQMGLQSSNLYPLIAKTHEGDVTVPIHDMSSYGMGWQVSLMGDGAVYHGGLNPNYTSYVAFDPVEKNGVIVMANSNSGATRIIGASLLDLVSKEIRDREFTVADGNDKAYSIVCAALCIYLVVLLGFTGMVIYQIFTGTRRLEGANVRTVGRIVLSIVLALPFLYGFYMLPHALLGMSWQPVIVWSPVSFVAMVGLALLSLVTTYLAYFITLLFPQQNKYKRVIPKILLVSIVSGMSNMVLILLIVSAINSKVELQYLVFYFLLTVAVHMFGRKFVQSSLIDLSKGIGFELRIKVFEKIFSTSYQKFENMDRGRVYTSVNDDVDTIGNSSNMAITLVTSVFTAVVAFLYLATMVFWATLMTLILIVALATLYYFVSKSTNKYYEEARDTRNIFMRLTNGMIDGFKEISLQRKKKLEYYKDITDAADSYRQKISFAAMRFLYASLLGESMLILLLGTVAFIIPRLFTDTKSGTIMNFVIVLLYLIGPVNRLLTAAPSILQLRIAWNRIQQFLSEIPSNLDLHELCPPLEPEVMSIKAQGLKFAYNSQEGFQVGAIDLEVKSGEILFIIGGNGSGKSTLAKLLTGLYEPSEGTITINEKELKSCDLSEYYSAVFSPLYIFGKLYNIDTVSKKNEIEKYLRVLNLENIVGILDNKYTTINLSGGQRKRLALLQCYLEDAPIYLFDEWAADQDPAYRNFFYRTLLPQMREAGKIVIAITHDDHYFDVADKILKMEHGKLEIYNDERSFTSLTMKIEKF